MIDPRYLAYRVLSKTFGKGSRVEHVMRKSYRAMEKRSSEGRDTRLEQRMKTSRLQRQGKGSKYFRTDTFTIMWSDRVEDPNRLGIYAKGSCDLPSIFATAPAVQAEVDGTAAAYMERGGASTARSDILLQTLQPLDPELVGEVSAKLDLPPRYFEPSVFEPTFRLPGYGYLGEFPKKVVVLSMAADLVRSVYQHKEHGLLVDPGGWWLNQDMSQVLSNLENVNWFRENFRKIGKLPIDQFRENYRLLIPAIKERTGAHVLILNNLEVEPGSQVHNYELVVNAGTERRRAFNLALIDLSRELGFSIVDVDRIMKNRGVSEQVDFAHFTTEGFKPLGEEMSRIFRDLGVLTR